MELLERDQQFRELEHHLHQTIDGHGRVVLIGGEAGVGKSALVDAFIGRHIDVARALKTTCDSLSTPGPLGPLLDIAPALGLDVMEMARNAQRRDVLFHSVLEMFRSRDEPTVLVGEDAHWSDEASIDLLRFMSRRIENFRLLFLVTYRDDELGPSHPLRRLIGDLASASSVYRIALEPLSANAVQILAAGTGHDPEVLFRETGGNPFFVTEVLATRGHQIPQSVTDAVLARASRLSPEARGVLDVAAVIGTHVPTHILVGVAGEVFEAIDECIDRGLCLPTVDGLMFRHELTRDAILRSISAPRGRLLHQRVLAALLAESGGATDFARLAHHAEQAGDRESTRQFATAAAKQASALFSHREAAAQYARVLRAGADLADSERATVLESYSNACYLSSEADEAIDAARQAVELWHRTGDRRAEGNAQRWLSRVLWFHGHNAEARRAGEKAVELLQSLPPGRELAMAYSNMSQLEMLRFDPVRTLNWGEKALELAERFDELETFVHASINVGSVRAIQSDPEGWTMLERAHHLAAEAGMIDHAERALINQGWMKMVLFQNADAEAIFDHAISYADDHDLDNYLWYVEASRAMARFYLGDWDTALESVESVLRVPTISKLTRIVALTVRGMVLSRRHIAGGDADLDEALSLSKETGELQRLGPVRLARSEAAWLAGDFERAVEEARAIEELAEAVGTPWIRGAIAYVLHRASLPLKSVDGLAEPYALMISGDWNAAAGAWQELGCVYERACALVESNDERAIRDALSIFASLGAVPAHDWAIRHLREMGIRPVIRGPRRSTLTNPSGLTRRELDVLSLLSEGLTNAEIADRLYISPKTAGHHVSAILAKLGVESRTAAALRATEIESASPPK